MRVGLALGAGGPLGWAFHLGVLDGCRAVGHDPSSVDRIVGTSAGAAVASSMLAGADTETVLSAVTTGPTPEERERFQEAFATLRRRPWRLLKPVAPGALTKWRPEKGLRPFLGLAPNGIFPTFSLRRFPGVVDLDPWPASLWITSVDVDTGDVEVFGRDRFDVPVIDAMEASGAVPAMFEPKEIHGRRFIDGAVASSTHADLLAHDDCDVVLVSSPMTRPGNGLVRQRARRQLASEVRALERSGARVLVLEPDEELMEIAEGFPRSRPDAGLAIADKAARMVEQAFG